jgi:hypothetical protein
MQSIRTHDLDLLLRFSGVEGRVKEKYPAEWSVVLRWTPERRHLPVGSSSVEETADTIACVQRIMEVLWSRPARIRKAMQEMAAQKGDLTLFALLRRADAVGGMWDLVVSAPWFRNSTLAATQEGY